jgi:hypothetical protein
VPLPSNGSRIHIQTQTDGRVFMKYFLEIGPGSMIYITDLIKIGSGVQKLMRGIHRHTDSKVIS